MSKKMTTTRIRLKDALLYVTSQIATECKTELVRLGQIHHPQKGKSNALVQHLTILATERPDEFANSAREALRRLHFNW